MITFQYGSLACNFLASLAIVSSIFVIGQAVVNPVNAVLWLIVAFVAVACYLITAGITFIGLSYIIVYVGAIAVLFLFVVIMLDLSSNFANTSSHLTGNTIPIAIIIGTAGFLVIIPLAGFLTLEAEMRLSILDLINRVIYSSENITDIIPSNFNFTTVWAFKPSFELIMPINQIQMLGLTLYTNGALWLLLLSVLLMLAIIVPLALAFT